MTRICVQDTETTGMNPATDRVVEYAHVVLSLEGGSWLQGGHETHLLDPEREIPSEASGVHHITREMVAGKPTLAEVLSRMRFDRVTHFAAHNREFDDGFLRPHLPDLPRICTWRVAAHLWPLAPDHKNQTLRYWLGTAPTVYTDSHGRGAHSALYDVSTTASVLVKMLEKVGLEEVVRLSDPSLPILQWVVRKTKYRGTAWKEMDAGFCRWVLNAKDPFDLDTQHTARYQLAWLGKAKEESDRPEWGTELSP